MAIVRRAAVEALGNIGPAAVAAVPALTEALKDSDSNVRSDAAWALSRIARKKSSTVPKRENDAS